MLPAVNRFVPGFQGWIQHAFEFRRGLKFSDDDDLIPTTPGVLGRKQPVKDRPPCRPSSPAVFVLNARMFTKQIMEVIIRAYSPIFSVLYTI